MSDKKKKEEPKEKPVEMPVEKKPHKKPEPKQEESATFKGIVRVAGRDVRGHVQLKKALTYIRGIGYSLSIPVANVLHQELNIAPETRIGDLSEQQIEQIDKILFHLHKHALPKFLLNRRKDMETGEDMHVIMNDLIFSVKTDVEREKKVYTWRGYRHSYGQKVRGQKTRNTGRTGMAVGVLRKAVLAQTGGAAAAPGAAAAGAAAPAGGKAAGPAPAGGKAAAPAAGAAAKPAPAKK
jgi:small subunit ribosomal protein S13